MLQHFKNNVWKPIVFGQRYEQLLHRLTKKIQTYLLSLNFELVTDHKLLLELLVNKPISDVCTRLQRFKMR